MLLKVKMPLSIGGLIDSNDFGGQPSYIQCQSPGRPLGARRCPMLRTYSYYYAVDHMCSAHHRAKYEVRHTN